MQVAVVDLGVGNLRSVEHAVRSVASNVEVTVTADGNVVEQADKIILPGQGAVGTWFDELRARKLESAIQSTLGAKPLLGICVGMQALYEFCEEDGGLPGLALLDGAVRHFNNFHPSQDELGEHRLKVPQMGWNTVCQRQDHAMWHGIDDNSYFYFVHSYCANSDNPQQVSGSSNYGHEFVAAACAPMTFAVQFHPEKSHDDGLRLLSNFVQWDGC